MNLRQLAKNVGQHLHLRPLPNRMATGGSQLDKLDDSWRLDSILDNPNRVRLINIHTGHVVELQSDNVKQYQSPHFLILRCQLTLTHNAVLIEPLFPATRQILPITRYQARGPAATSSYSPCRPEICDGCTAAVQFRTITGIQLLNPGGTFEQPEQFCPQCARRRGLTVMAPPGMSNDVLFADTNPSLRAHVHRLLQTFGLSYLSADPQVRANGVTRVSAVVSAEWVTLLVDGPLSRSLEVPIPLHELAAPAAESDIDLMDAMKARLLSALPTPR